MTTRRWRGIILRRRFLGAMDNLILIDEAVEDTNGTKASLDFSGCDPHGFNPRY